MYGMLYGIYTIQHAIHQEFDSSEASTSKMQQLMD